MKIVESKQNLSSIFLQATTNALINNGPPLQGSGLAPVPGLNPALEMGGSIGAAVKRTYFMPHYHPAMPFKRQHLRKAETLSMTFNKAAQVELAKQGKKLSRAPSKASDKLKEKFREASMER